MSVCLEGRKESWVGLKSIFLPAVVWMFLHARTHLCVKESVSAIKYTIFASIQKQTRVFKIMFFQRFFIFYFSTVEYRAKNTQYDSWNITLLVLPAWAALELGLLCHGRDALRRWWYRCHGWLVHRAMLSSGFFLFFKAQNCYCILL